MKTSHVCDEFVQAMQQVATMEPPDQRQAFSKLFSGLPQKMRGRPALFQVPLIQMAEHMPPVAVAALHSSLRHGEIADWLAEHPLMYTEISASLIKLLPASARVAAFCDWADHATTMVTNPADVAYRFLDAAADSLPFLLEDSQRLKAFNILMKHPAAIRLAEGDEYNRGWLFALYLRAMRALSEQDSKKAGFVGKVRSTELRHPYRLSASIYCPPLLNEVMIVTENFSGTAADLSRRWQCPKKSQDYRAARVEAQQVLGALCEKLAENVPIKERQAMLRQAGLALTQSMGGGRNKVRQVMATRDVGAAKLSPTA